MEPIVNGQMQGIINNQCQFMWYYSVGYDIF